MTYNKQFVVIDQTNHASNFLHNMSLHKQSLIWGVIGFFIVVALQSIFIKHFGVNAPYMDEWANYELINKLNNGTLTFDFLFRQHNEHRIFFPRLFWVLFYMLIGEVNLLLQMFISAIIIGLAAGLWTATLVRIRLSPWLALLTCIALTTPAQWENTLTSFQLVFWLMTASIVVALCLIVFSSGLSWLTVALVIFAGVVSSFSAASGMVVWASAGLSLLLRVCLDAPSFRELLLDRLALLKLGLFVLGAVVSAAFYFYGYHSVSGHSGLQARQLSVYFAWFFRVTTYPILEYDHLFNKVVAVGQWLLIILGLVFYFYRRNDAIFRRKLVFIAGFMSFILLNAAIMAYGRGNADVIASRYITFFTWTFGVLMLTSTDLLIFLASRRGILENIGLFMVALFISAIVTINGFTYLGEFGNFPARYADRMNQTVTTINYLMKPSEPIRGPKPTIDMLFYDVLPDLNRRNLLPDWILNRTWVLPASSFGDAWSFRGVRSATNDRASWGSWNGDLLSTGRIESVPILITQPYLGVNITGYPNRSGNRLILETLDGSGHWLRYNDVNPGLTWHEWYVDVSAFMGRYVRIVAIDNSTDAQGWLGFGSVRFASPTVRILDSLIGNLEWLLGGTFILIMTAAFVVSQTPPDLRSRPVVAVTLLVIAGLTIYFAQTPPASQTLFSLQPQRLTQESFDPLQVLPPSFMDTSAVKRVPNGLFMHPNAGLVLGPFESQTALCFTAQAQIDPSAPVVPEHDGVQFVAQVQVGDQVLAQTQTTVSSGHPSEMRLDLPAHQPFTISLQTQMRNNSAYDWAIWHQPQIAPCSP